MESFLIPWIIGDGNIVLKNNGGDSTVSSDSINNSVDRSQILTFTTSDNSVTATLTVNQKGKRVILRSSDGSILRDNSQVVLTSII